MNWNEYNRLKQIVDKELVITEDNALKKSLDTPLLYHKYLDICTNQMRYVKTLTKDVKKKYKERYEHFKFKSDFQLDSKSEIETFIFGDEEYANLKHELDTQEIILHYLEEVLSTIQKSSFHIKNFIDYAKFRAGQ